MAVELPIYQRTGDGVVKEKAAKKYLTLTYGCQMNERDTATIAVVKEVHQEASSLRSDLIVLNTCVRTGGKWVYGKLASSNDLNKINRICYCPRGCRAQLDEACTN